MDTEIESYSRLLQLIVKRLYTSLEGLSEAQLNWRPPTDGANSAYVIAAHTLGNARAWVLGIACGRPIERDRPAEFRASGHDATELTAQGRQLSDDMVEALTSLSPADLERRLVPPRSLWGEGEPWEISVREALLHVVEHASLHVGQLQITRDLALREAKA
jgi:uncharacterized damage-inducible protein DinB